MNKDLSIVLSENLKFFMNRMNVGVPGLAKMAKVAQNTVHNYVDPKKRTVTSTKQKGYPTLDKLEHIAKALGCEVWELLHPDIQRSIREREMYRNIEMDMIERLKRDGNHNHQTIKP